MHLSSIKLKKTPDFNTDESLESAAVLKQTDIENVTQAIDQIKNIAQEKKIKPEIETEIKAIDKSLINSFNEELFLKTNNLNPESVFAIFLPNTYEFYWNTSADQFRDKMLNQYNLFWNSSRKKKADSLNLSPIQVSVLASIVQRETPKVDERPTISGVYFNRLKKRMKLQADPTVVYTIKKTKGFDKKIRRVLYKDLKIKSPYNTYLNRGLPPGPIYMSDFSSIESVLNMENNDYLFWYISAAKLEPRLGERYNEEGSELEQHLGVAKMAQKLHSKIQKENFDLSVAEYLVLNPEFRGIIRRIQSLEQYPFAEVQDNILSKETIPINMLRFKLSFFGANRYDPKSDRWLRVSFFSGAPFLSNLNEQNVDSWGFATMSSYH